MKYPSGAGTPSKISTVTSEMTTEHRTMRKHEIKANLLLLNKVEKKNASEIWLCPELN